MVSTVDRGVLLIHRFVVGLAVIVSCGGGACRVECHEFSLAAAGLGDGYL